MTAPDETPRATLAEDGRERLITALFDPDYSRVEHMVVAEVERILTARLTPLLAAARAAAWDEGSAAGFRDGEAFAHDKHDNEGYDETPNPYTAARIAEGAEQREDTHAPQRPRNGPVSDAGLQSGCGGTSRAATSRQIERVFDELLPMR